MITVCWILMRWDSLYPGPCLHLWILGAGLFTGASGLFYVWDFTQQLSAHPSSSRTRKGYGRTPARRD
jgi:hypothetical protein